MGWMAAAAAGVVALVGIVAGWLQVGRRPQATAASQTRRAALAFPILAVLGFAILATLAIVDAGRADLPGQSQYMPVFALFFFLVYALVLGLVIGWPAAAFGVWWRRRHIPDQPGGPGA